MTEIFPYALMFLCQPNGDIVTADRQAMSLWNGGGSLQTEEGVKQSDEEFTVAGIASKVSCSELISIFKDFAVNDQSSAQSLVNCGSYECRLSLRRLNGFQSQPMIAIELNRESDESRERAMLIEVGRATSKLIHDFKNQMGGLKLYAAYLKKRFASQPDLAEGLEIADKIAQSISEMAENAALIGKLTSPLELKIAKSDFPNLIEQIINQLQPQISERRLTVENLSSGLIPPLEMDSQHMLIAIGNLIARSIEASPEGGILKFSTLVEKGEIRFSIIDSGESLSDERRQGFFDYLNGRRLNRASLKLALARHIIQSHGGQVMAQTAEPFGTELLVKLRI